MNIEKFVENLNKLSKVKVYRIDILKSSIVTKKEDIKKKKDEILGELKEMGLNFNTYDEKEVVKDLGIPNLNRDTLKERITSTGKRIYILFDELKTLNTALQGYDNLSKNIDKDGYIHPKFSINVKGLVSVAEPGLARLEDEFITKVLGFDRCGEFKSFDNLYNFIRKYRPMLGVREDNQNSFIVVGMKLFFDFKEVEPWDITKAYGEKVREMHLNEHIFLTSAREKFITGETYKLFDKVYNELLPVLENTRVSRDSGLTCVKWFAPVQLHTFDWDDDGSGISHNLPFGDTKEDMIKYQEEAIKLRMDEFNSLYSQYLELRAEVDKDEDISYITKEKEITNQIKERLKNRVVNRKYDEGLRGAELREAVEIEIDRLIREVYAVKFEPKQEQQ